ncbi:MAG: MCE family protein [Opitutaceae bacterium]|nr:MCE family protein [Opitutaceae bacterium]
MKYKASPALVGFFVLGAILLVLVALFSFGGINLFAKPERFIVYFNESIQGLDLGSPVKLRGVRVGRVVDLNIRYAPAKNQSVVAVVCELSRSSLMDEKGTLIDLSNRRELQKLIDEGLRAQLGVLGLATGLLYVELNFVDPKEFPARPASAADTRFAVVPAMDSTIKEFQANLDEILVDLRHVDFAGLAKEIRGLLVDMRRQINGLDLAGLSQEWTKAGRSLDALASSKEFPKAVENLNAALVEFRTTLGRLDSTLQPTAAQLADTLSQARSTLASFASAAATAQAFIHAQSGLGEEAGIALARFAEAAASIQRLTDFLERNPNSLLTGRKAPQ